MKYIDYVNDWFALYINPVDYEGKADQFTQHIFQTLPFLDKLPKNAEYNSLVEVITLNSQILIQIIEEDNPKDASAAFINLKEQITRLKNHVKHYALNHFNDLFQQDHFYTKLQEYINSTVTVLSVNEWRALQESYVDHKIEELSLALTIKLANEAHMPDLVTQTELDKLSIEEDKIRFLGKVRSIILGSNSGATELKSNMEAKILTFCDYVEKNTAFKQKYDKRGMRQVVAQFLKQHFADIKTLEKINNDIKVNQISLQSLLRQEKLKHRSPKNLEIIQQQITSIKQKLATNQALYDNRQREFEAALLAFYQTVLRSPLDEKFQEVISLFQLAPFLSRSESEGFLQRTAGLFKLFAATVDTFLPSEMDLQLGMLGVAAGAFVIGTGPIGMSVGLGVGIAAVKTNQTVIRLAHETKQEWHACLEALYGKFTAIYKSAACKVNQEIKRICDNDATKAAVINAFYVRQLFEYDLKIASETKDPENTQLKKEKAQFEKHYQQLRNGQVKSKDFWENNFKQDIAICVHNLQRLQQIHTNAYFMCLYEELNGQPIRSQRDFHQNRLTGILEALKELSLLASKNKWQKFREQNIAALRGLLKTPFDFTFEDHVNRFVCHHSPLHILFWLREQATDPRKILAQPLPSFENKTFWHLLAEREDGADLMQQMLNLEEVAPPQRASAKLIQKCWHFIASVKNKALFDPDCIYQEMNPLAYAYQQGNTALLRVYLQEVLQHPNQVKAIGLKKLFQFMITTHPQVIPLIEAIKPNGVEALAAALPFYQKASIQLGIMAALTMYTLKEGSLPQGKGQWQHFLLELKQDHSAYIQVESLRDYQSKQMDDLVLLLAHERTLPPQLEPQLEAQPPTLLIQYQAPTQQLVAVVKAKTAIRTRKKKGLPTA